MLKIELLTLWKLAVFPFILDYIHILIVQINMFSDVKILNMFHGLIGFLSGC